ncbi:DUF3108 domain-containing protein [Arenicellales bacterium IMCC55707]|nr:DUF3108 domain-containing protein [Actinomycetota bacterium]
MSYITEKLLRPFQGSALVLALIFFPQLGASSTEIELLSPYRAEYAVDYSGFNAKRVITLETVGDEYVLNAVTTLKGVARLSGYGPVYEVSRFSIVDGVVRPYLYTISEKKPNPKRDIKIEFDWETGMSSGFAKGESQSFPIFLGIQDPLSFELMARLNLIKGNRDFAIQVNEGHRIREYRFIEKENQTLYPGDYAVSTSRFFIDRNSSRELYYWFSDENLYLPIQVQQVHGQKIKGTVNLEKSSLLQ